MLFVDNVRVAEPLERTRVQGHRLQPRHRDFNVDDRLRREPGNAVEP